MTRINNFVIASVAVAVLASSAASANQGAPTGDDWCRNLRLGWHFYCDEKKKPKQKEAQSVPPNKPEQSAADRMKDLQARVDEARAAAVLDATPENVEAYLQLNKMMLDKASTFADQWQRVVWRNPTLDATQKVPVNTLGKEAWKASRDGEKTQVLATLSERYGVFYVYLSTCPYCQAYSPILKNFAERYGITVQAVTLDGGVLPDWPETVVNQGQWQAWGLADQSVPATLLYDRQTKKIIPVAFGLLSEAELEERIYLTTAKEVGDDF